MRMAAIDLVCLGDSIVYGYGTYPMGAWPRLAGEALGIRILNQGENGDTDADGRQKQLSRKYAFCGYY